MGVRLIIPGTRIMKNSSMLEWQMARNLTLSSSGLLLSKASSRHLLLNSSQDSSLLM